MKTIKVILVAGLMMMMAFFVKAQNANEFTIPFSDPAKRGTLKAHLNYGSITIKGTARKDILVKYTEAKSRERDREDEDDEDRPRPKVNVKVNINTSGGSGSETSKEGLKKISGSGFELEASENNNVVKIGSDSWNARTNLEIEVPSGIDIKVSTYNDGDLMVSNIQGEVELTSYNGPITALNVSGSAIATTYNGDIKVTFDKVADGKPMSYSTYNGDIDLTFPSAAKATFKMKTERGDIYTGFDMNVTSSGPVKQADPKSGGYKLKIDEWKRGDINGGGAELSMKTYNGDVYIRKK